MRRCSDRRWWRVTPKVAAAANYGGWQWIAGFVQQVGAGVAEERARHVEGGGEAERAHQIACARIHPHERQAESSRVTAFARRWWRVYGKALRVGFPPQALVVR